MMNAKSIECVIFDLDGTLYPVNDVYDTSMAALCAEASKLLGIPTSELLETMARIGHAQWEFDHKTAGYHNRIIRSQLMLEERGLPLRHALTLDAAYWKTYLSIIRPFPDAAETLAELRKRGIRVGLGTNMTADVQYRKLVAMNLLDYFDFIVTSEETGIEKPAPEFFAACISKARCTADRCLFVGDDAMRDFGGATAAGMNAYWLAPDPEKRASKPDIASIASLSEILADPRIPARA